MDNIRFDPKPQSSASRHLLHFSQEIRVRFNDQNREISVMSKNKQLNQNPKSKDVMTWDFFQKTKNINPFTIDKTPNNLPQKSSVSSKIPTRTTANSAITTFSPQAPTNKKIFGPAESLLEDYKIGLSQEMSLRLHVNLLDVQIGNGLYPNWVASYNPPPNLITNQNIAEDLVEKRRSLANIMLETNRDYYKRQLAQTVEENDSLTSSIKALYREPNAAGFDLNFALNSAVEDATLAKAKKFEELDRILTAIRAAPEAALWIGISNEFERPPRAQKPNSTNPPNPAPSNNTNQVQNRPNQQVRSQNTNRGGVGPRSSRPTNRPNNNKNFQRDRSQSAKGKNNKRRKQQDLATKIGFAVQSVIKNHF